MAAAARAKKPVKLQLVQFVCIETEDNGFFGEADELVIQVNGTTVLDRDEDVNDGDTVELSGLGTFKFRKSITVTVLDQDGNELTRIGSVTVPRGLVGKGLQQVDLQENGADYTLAFKVIK